MTSRSESSRTLTPRGKPHWKVETINDNDYYCYQWREDEMTKIGLRRTGLSKSATVLDGCPPMGTMRQLIARDHRIRRLRGLREHPSRAGRCVGSEANRAELETALATEELSVEDDYDRVVIAVDRRRGDERSTDTAVVFRWRLKWMAPCSRNCWTEGEGALGWRSHPHINQRYGRSSGCVG